jgi:hypothetical protein
VSTCEHLDTPAVLHHVPGLSYRRLHYWTVAALIPGAHRHAVGGSGVPLYYHDDDVILLRRVLALVEPPAGMLPGPAFELAQHGWIILPNGTWLVLAEPL